MLLMKDIVKCSHQIINFTQIPWAHHKLVFKLLAKCRSEQSFKLSDTFITYTNPKAVKYGNNFLALLIFLVTV